MTLNRRDFAVATGSVLAFPTAFAATPASDKLVTLWPDVPPGGGGPNGAVQANAKGAITNIAVPALEVYASPKPNGAAMLIAAGGGYKRIEVEKEARPAARWLAERGVTAFVLRYRLPREGWQSGPLAPLQDAQRALRVLQNDRGGQAIDPARIGVLGFSAGGHLMGLAAARSGFTSYDPIDALDAASARPAVAALAYPVVTLEPPYARTSTRMQLVGHRPSAAESAEWSVQTHVRERCPPMFLVQAENDRISNIANTAILEQACRQVSVPVERHVLPSGGHGFGMGRPDTPTAEWPKWLEVWLRARGMIG